MVTVACFFTHKHIIQIHIHLRILNLKRKIYNFSYFVICKCGSIFFDNLCPNV